MAVNRPRPAHRQPRCRVKIGNQVPEAVAVQPGGYMVGSGFVAKGDYVIPTAHGVRVVNAEFARGWNEARAALEAAVGDMVLVQRSSVEMASVVCNEWAQLFVETPGFDKYVRYNYGPAVEMLRDELRALLAAANGEGEKDG